MGIDLSSVDWTFVGLMTALAFVTALLGSLIVFRNRFAGAIVGAILFGIGFVFWNYWPHQFGLPILKSTGLDGPAAPAAAATPQSTAQPAAPAAPAPPSNPVTTLPPPSSPPGGNTAPPAGGTMAPNASH
jgi:hypothetical protein